MPTRSAPDQLLDSPRSLCRPTTPNKSTQPIEMNDAQLESCMVGDREMDRHQNEYLERHEKHLNLTLVVVRPLLSNALTTHLTRSLASRLSFLLLLRLSPSLPGQSPNPTQTVKPSPSSMQSSSPSTTPPRYARLLP